MNIVAADTSHLRQSNPELAEKYRDEDIDGIRYTGAKPRPIRAMASSG
ncbi:hypothetical protein [Paludibacterium denitrificans]|nr:hypothetical protein [Paludibacterium denitrificans]